MIKRVQPNVFDMQDELTNMPVDCADLEGIDLELWREKCEWGGGMVDDDDDGIGSILRGERTAHPAGGEQASASNPHIPTALTVHLRRVTPCMACTCTAEGVSPRK